MANADVQLDLMELADIRQPVKLAHELHRQMRVQFGSVPTASPLRGLASALGIEAIEEHDSEAIEGMLVIQDGRGAVSLRRGMRPGRKNFTLAHEIGHFTIPNHRFQGGKFQCGKRDFNQSREAGNWDKRPLPERIEVEANEFAAALLVPMAEFAAERRKLGTGCDIAHVRDLAETFAVSQEVMAKVYVQAEDEAAAIIISHNGLVRRVIPQRGFPYLGLRSGVPVPAASLSKTFKGSGDNSLSNLVEVPGHAWLQQQGNVTALYEQAFVQEAGWIMTLLVADLADEDDEDDSAWNRR
jgi:Zn-dependent peptidase ImmA (M78 family)